jgi:hypothetical protein
MMGAGNNRTKVLLGAAAILVVVMVAVVLMRGSKKGSEQAGSAGEAARGKDPAAQRRGHVALTPSPKGFRPDEEGADPNKKFDPVACSSCEKEHIKNGKCEPMAGCDDLTGQDKELCLNLLSCMRRTGCWLEDPLRCLCGTFSDLECAQGSANGVCKAEMNAATKSTDTLRNGMLFYNPTIPAGRANQLISCDHENCVNVCGG